MLQPFRVEGQPVPLHSGTTELLTVSDQIIPMRSISDAFHALDRTNTVQFNVRCQFRIIVCARKYTIYIFPMGNQCIIYE